MLLLWLTWVFLCGNRVGLQKLSQSSEWLRTARPQAVESYLSSSRFHDPTIDLVNFLKATHLDQGQTDESRLLSLGLCRKFDHLTLESEYPELLAPDEARLFGPDVAAKTGKEHSHKRKVRSCSVHKSCREILDRIVPSVFYREYTSCSTHVINA